MAKVMVSIPDELLARLDAAATQRRTTRSGLLAAAAMHELERADVAEIDAAIERSRAAFAQVGSFDSAELVRSERDRRL